MIFQNEKTPLQVIKTRSSKSRKIDIFPQGVNAWFWSKNGHFSNFFFYALQTRKMYSMIFQNEKTPFWAIKTRSSKSRKIDIFPKGLTHGFGPKMAIFRTFSFSALQTIKMYFMIFQNEKTPFQTIKRRRSKSRKIDILLKGLTDGFGPKMAIFSNFFFLRKIDEENVFYDILERKNAFLGYKNKNLKKSKN